MISSKRLSASALIKEIAYELKDQLERRYGSQLKDVVLFGLYAWENKQKALIST